MKNAPEMPLNIENSSLDMQEFYTAAEIADLKLPGVPSTPQSVTRKAKTENWHDQKNMAGAPLVRHRSGRGGGFEYHYVLLPGNAQAALIHRARVKAAQALPPAARKADIDRDALWEFYDRLSGKKKAKAKNRLDILLSVLALEKGGTPKNVAVAIVAMKSNVSNRSIYNWFVMPGSHRLVARFGAP
ncbi:MAG: hypothetical protein COA47_17415 [Robiginitomaculum sp.]|nr:MAG: hypothetical protein COA47_17415 [Robiginitomaculum sp.]